MSAEPETRADRIEAPQAKSGRPQHETPQQSPPQPEPPSRRRVWLRRALFLLLPLVLIIGGIWYVRGGKVITTDNAYVNADKVGVSTDVSGVVMYINVSENQRVEPGQVLYRLEPLPFQLALDRADAQLGMVANDFNALKANHADAQAQLARRRAERRTITA